MPWKRLELWHNYNWLLHHNNASAHMTLKTTEFVTNNNMAYPPYSPDLAPYDFALFPKLKMKLKGGCFETVSDIQRESQAGLDSRKMTSMMLSKRGKNDGIAIYIPKETILKEMAAKNE
jgi:transposase